MIVAAALMLTLTLTRSRTVSSEHRAAESKSQLACWAPQTECGTGVTRQLRRPMSRQAQVLARIDTALCDIDGCFEEWAQGTSHREASLTLAVIVSRDGWARADALAPMTPHDSVVTPLC